MEKNILITNYYLRKLKKNKIKILLDFLIINGRKYQVGQNKLKKNILNGIYKDLDTKI